MRTSSSSDSRGGSQLAGKCGVSVSMSPACPARTGPTHRSAGFVVRACSRRQSTQGGDTPRSGGVKRATPLLQAAGLLRGLGQPVQRTAPLPQLSPALLTSSPSPKMTGQRPSPIQPYSGSCSAIHSTWWRWGSCDEVLGVCVWWWGQGDCLLRWRKAQATRPAAMWGSATPTATTATPTPTTPACPRRPACTCG
jgi:hypothetical protein